MEPDDGQLERHLRDRRPEPDPLWRLELGERLAVPRRSARLALPRVRWLPVVAGAIGGAAAVLVAGVLGGGPLGQRSDEPVSAKDRCREVTVVRAQRVPTVVRTADGALEVRYRTERRPVEVRRCG